jgi:hypothetical protein
MSTQFRSRVVTLFTVLAASVVLCATSAQASPAVGSTDSIPESDPGATGANGIEATSTSSQDLVTPAQTDSSSELDRVAQEVTPGRATRSGPSYIGIGGNVGFGGDSSLGDGSFAVYSKIGLTRNFSARPGVLVGANDPTLLVPVTVDLPIAPIADDVDFAVAPFVGGGVAISTGSDSVVRPMAVGGVDVPLSDRFTATAQGNVAFFSDVEGSVILGVGYNF